MTTLSVPDMNCGHCKASVEAALAPLAHDIQIDLVKREVSFADLANTDAALIALLEVGFPASVVSQVVAKGA